MQIQHFFNGPYSIGFDRLIDRMERFHDQTKISDNYPPFNIKRISEDHFVLEVAVAGITEEDIDLTYQDSALTIKATGSKEEGSDYLHQGIAKRGFERKFSLADTIEVRGAALINGMLTVELINVIPDEKKPRKIEITKQLLLEQ